MASWRGKPFDKEQGGLCGDNLGKANANKRQSQAYIHSDFTAPHVFFLIPKNFVKK
jgi:hypothetical protein